MAHINVHVQNVRIHMHINCMAHIHIHTCIHRAYTSPSYLGGRCSLLHCSSGPLWKNPVALTESAAMSSSISIRSCFLLKIERKVILIMNQL